MRDERRRRIIELKRLRRVALGDAISLVFENDETVLFQIQEMVRAEGITDPAKVQDEIDTYNAILPRANELAGTLFIELTNPETIERDLDRYVGLDRGCVFLRVGDAAPVPAIFEEGHASEDRIAAVHFIRFALPAALAENVRSTHAEVRIEVQHPACAVTALASPALRDAMRHDLTPSA